VLLRYRILVRVIQAVRGHQLDLQAVPALQEVKVMPVVTQAVKDLLDILVLKVKRVSLAV
jgi:hypothetical protein